MSDLVPTIAADDARDRLARVRARVEDISDDLTALYVGRAWIALGFDSWESLCDAELGGVRIALPRAERREVVAGMREAGLSTRAIGAALGVNQATVVRDLSAGDADASPAPVAGRDGKTYPAKVTTTTRTTEATKVERDVDLDTGEIVDLGTSEAAGRAAADRVDLTAVGVPDVPTGPSFMTRFMTSLCRAQDVLRFDPESLAAKADRDEWSSFLALVDSMNTYADKARAARPGLRAVKG